MEMRVQDLKHRPKTRFDRQPLAVQIARLIAFGGAALLTAMGTYEMLQVVDVGGVTVLEGAMTAIFAVTFGWIAFSACSVLAGVLTPPAPHVRLARTGNRLSTRTALVMPIYHEDPAGTTAALEVDGTWTQCAGRSARIRDRRSVGFHERRFLGGGNSRRRSPARRAHRRHAGLVSPPLVERGPQGRERQGFRRELGRPLFAFHRAGRRQPDVARRRW